MNRQQQRARIAQLITDLHFEKQIGDEDAALLRSLAEEAQGEPVAEVRCWEEPRYEKPPRQFYELTQLDGFRALPAGTHALYTHPPAKQAPLTDEEIGTVCAACAVNGTGTIRAIEAACAKKWGVKL